MSAGMKFSRKIPLLGLAFLISVITPALPAESLFLIAEIKPLGFKRASSLLASACSR